MKEAGNPKQPVVKTESDFKQLLARLLRKPHIRHEDMKVNGDHKLKKGKTAK